MYYSVANGFPILFIFMIMVVLQRGGLEPRGEAPADAGSGAVLVEPAVAPQEHAHGLLLLLLSLILLSLLLLLVVVLLLLSIVV